MTGVLESPVFRLDGPTITFRIGGGNRPDTYVALCTLDGTEVLQARGANSEFKQPATWDATAHVGQHVFLRVVDRHTGGWGHVTLDDFTAVGRVDHDATEAHRLATVRARARARMDGMGVSLRAAIADLQETFGDAYPGGEAYVRRLETVEAQVQAATDAAALRQAEEDLLALQRDALIANPLVSGDPILFVARAQYLPDHHNTATIFQTGEINTGSFRGAGALKTVDFGNDGRVATLLDAPEGIARDPDVSFDGQRVLLSLRHSIDDDYHLYEIPADGSEPVQLTFGAGVSDIDPLYLPDGRIAFTSTREPKYCMCNRHIMGNLFRMDADGANVHQIGKSTLFEGHGNLMPDGRILYDRWEYVDRNFGDAQGLWACNPDGTEHVLYWGNNTPSPGAVLEARVIPGTQQALALFSSCHDRPWGALAIVDRSHGLDGKAPVMRTWPESAMDLVMRGNYDAFVATNPKYEDPFPLSDKHFLCSRMTGDGEQMGIYLLDTFGNEILLHVEGAGCYDPMPLRSYSRPPVIPDRVQLAQDEGRVYVYDVYQGTGMDAVERGTVKSIRVVESPEKRFWTPDAWPGQGQEAPAMNWHDFNNKRIIGTAPVEPDGSAHFTVPADTFVYFQLLDERGMMVQSMRSGMTVRPGETAGCVGCHEDRGSAIPGYRTKAALTRPPSRLAEWYGPPRLFSYADEVQPVFDAMCVSCHDYDQPAGEKLNLAGDRGLAFNASYNELWRKGIVKAIGAGPAEIQPPYSWGSHASALVDAILAEDFVVELDDESFDRIVTWIDINAPYYPTYASAYPANRYGRSPLDNQQLARLGELTGLNLLDGQGDFEDERSVSFDRPELSPCLVPLRQTGGPAYEEALGIITAGQKQLAEVPRADLPGFALLGIEAEREAKYEMLAATERQAREALLAGEKRYPLRGEGAPGREG